MKTLTLSTALFAILLAATSGFGMPVMPVERQITAVGTVEFGDDTKPAKTDGRGDIVPFVPGGN